MCRVCSYIYFAWISASLVTLSISDGDYVPESPCPDLFRYETSRGQWYGVIKRASATYGSDIDLRLNLSIREHIPRGYRGYVDIFGNAQQARLHIYEGLPFYYKVVFPQAAHLPKVVEVAFNDEVVCRGEPVNRKRGRPVTDYTLSYNFNAADESWQTYNNRPYHSPWPQDQQVSIVNHPADGGLPEYSVFNINAESADEAIDKFLSTLSSGGSNNAGGDSAPQANSDAPSTDPPDMTMTQRIEHVWQQPETTPTISPDPVEPPSQPSECGIVGDNTLFIKGEETNKGDWPWLVAIYVERPSSLDFRCAGTLVSHRHVVTAAHCVRDSSNRPVPVDGVLIKVGVFNLQEWTDRDVKQVGLKNILQHPKYTGGSSHLDDIAVLIFPDPLEYNTYIRPACLWEMDTDQEKVVGRNGTVVGWGRDEYGLVATPEPRQGRVPIVSTTTCRSSHADFARLTSNNTLCAGARDGTGPCNGDSGGGLYLNVQSRWYLRGIVSISIPGSETPCNLNEYVVYTDAAKYMPWIRAIIKASS